VLDLFHFANNTARLADDLFQQGHDAARLADDLFRQGHDAFRPFRAFIRNTLFSLMTKKVKNSHLWPSFTLHLNLYHSH
jgi:hypothetical protein